MIQEEFAMAVVMNEEGWEFLCVTPAGDMSFIRTVAGVTFVADVRADR